MFDLLQSICPGLTNIGDISLPDVDVILLASRPVAMTKFPVGAKCPHWNLHKCLRGFTNCTKSSKISNVSMNYK